MSPSKVSTLDFTKFYNIVDGQQRSSKSVHHSINPATLENLWDVPIATQQDVNDAVVSAKNAFKSWSQVPIEKRKEYLGKFMDLYSTYEEEFTNLIIKEVGKPRFLANMEVKGVNAFAAWHQQIDLPVEVIEDDEKIIKTFYKPLGVCVGIVPWNFPIMLATSKFASAVISGNTIIIKPSPYTPYSCLKLFELAQEIFPPGVIQVIGGTDDLGPMLTAHPDVAKISFTGSIATGKKIMQACSKTLKRVTLELGGNDATIVMPDVDIEKVAPQVAMGAFINSGQVCVATKRIYIHESIYRPFVDAMVNFTKTLKVGDGFEPGVMIGPIQNSMQYEKVKGFFADSKTNNHKFAVGSADVAESKGYFIQPAIVDNPPNGSRLVEEEPFGPIVPTQPWSDLEEVIERANNTDTGLAACVYGKDVAAAEKVAERLEAGSVFVNSSERPTVEGFFGGHKQSGIGGELGKTGIFSYCNILVMHTYKN